MRAFLMCFMLLASTLTAWAQGPKGAEIEFSTKVVDLGTLSREDDKQIVRISARKRYTDNIFDKGYTWVTIKED